MIRQKPTKASTISRKNGLIVTLAFAGAEILDIAGPLDILCSAPCYRDKGFDMSLRLRSRLVSEFGGNIQTIPSGISIQTESLNAINDAKIDTLIIPGGYEIQQPLGRPALINWIKQSAARARRVVSICTGAFLLGEAGLLSGKRATTHWRYVEQLAQMYPDVAVEPDSIFTSDGNVYTSAGITSGMDLALQLVTEDWGAETALQIARDWLLYAKRPGGQSQFSELLPPKGSERETITKLQSWIMENLSADLTVATLARRLCMSPRHFARVFQSETGTTPAKFVETVRIEAARRWLEQGSQSIETIADECGMGDSERLRRSFIRRLGVNPSDYRRRFENRSLH